MSEAVTDCEVKFLALLDDWCAILPDGEHIDLELRDVYLPRALMQMSRADLLAATHIVTDIIEDFAKLAESAIEGGMRASWLDSFRDLINEFLLIGDMFWETLKLRTH